MRLDGPLDGLQVDVVAGQQGSQDPVVQVDEILHSFNKALQFFLTVAEQDRVPVEVALAHMLDGGMRQVQFCNEGPATITPVDDLILVGLRLKGN